jgi:hypothetical protein
MKPPPKPSAPDHRRCADPDPRGHYVPDLELRMALYRRLNELEDRPAIDALRRRDDRPLRPAAGRDRESAEDRRASVARDWPRPRGPVQRAALPAIDWPCPRRHRPESAQGKRKRQDSPAARIKDARTRSYWRSEILSRTTRPRRPGRGRSTSSRRASACCRHTEVAIAAGAMLRQRYEWADEESAQTLVALGGDGFILQTLHQMLESDRRARCSG